MATGWGDRLQPLRSGAIRRALAAYLLFDVTEWMASVAVLVWATSRAGQSQRA